MLKPAIIAGAIILVLGSGAVASERGIASWYSRGNPVTACGMAFNPYRIAAAHKTLPCGSKVQIIVPETGKSIIVEIFDRGPFIPGRIIDVTVEVARRLGFVDQGVAKVLVVPLK